MSCPLTFTDPAVHISRDDNTVNIAVYISVYIDVHIAVGDNNVHISAPRVFKWVPINSCNG